MRKLPEAERKRRVVERVRLWRLANPEKAAALRAKQRKGPRPASARALAKAAGLKFYETGKPCVNGHVAPRRVDCKKCVECLRAKARDYFARNREIRCEKTRAAYQQRKHLRPALTDEQMRQAVARVQRWRLANPEQARAQRWVRKARLKNAAGTYTGADLVERFRAQKQKCAYCRARLKRAAFHVDHIIPLVGGGSNWPSNIQLLCPPCNMRKSGSDPIDWARKLGRLL